MGTHIPYYVIADGTWGWGTHPLIFLIFGKPEKTLYSHLDFKKYILIRKILWGGVTWWVGMWMLR